MNIISGPILCVRDENNGNICSKGNDDERRDDYDFSHAINVYRKHFSLSLNLSKEIATLKNTPTWYRVYKLKNLP